MVRVQDDGAVRLEKYKNIGVLGTDANGFLVDGSNLNIPSVQNIAFGINSVTNTANSVYTVLFNVAKSTPNITYNNGTFTINKAGFYQFTAFILYDISMNSPTGGSGVTRCSHNGGTTVAYNLTALGDGTQSFGHTLSGVDYFNVGDVFTVTAAYSRAFKVQGGSVTIVYYGT